ncbi:MAG: CBS domain-containing protein [Rubrivivax sp.]
MQVGALVGGGPIVSVAEQADIGEAIALMQGSGVRRLLVCDAEGHLLGVTSFDDLLRVRRPARRAGAGAWPRPQAGGRRGTRPAAAAGVGGGSAQAAARPPQPRLRVPAMGTGAGRPDARVRLAPARPGEP